METDRTGGLLRMETVGEPLKLVRGVFSEPPIQWQDIVRAAGTNLSATETETVSSANVRPSFSFFTCVTRIGKARALTSRPQYRQWWLRLTRLKSFEHTCPFTTMHD